MQITVHGNQVHITGRFYYAAVIDDDILSGITGYITGIGRLHGNIANMGRCLAVNDDLAVFSFQFYILLSRYGLCISAVAAYMDIAIHRLYVYIRIS